MRRVVDANDAIVRRLYDALGKRDGDAMAACYAPDARFSDPVFPDLRGAEVGDMWRMLTMRAPDLRVQLGAVKTTEYGGDAEWEARYTFSKTGHAVHNFGHARFTFQSGLILQHLDEWDFPKWAGQALGWRGRFLGKSAMLRQKVRKDAEAGLRRFRDAGPPR